MREASPQESAQVQAQGLEEFAIRALIPVESEQQKPAQALLRRTHAFPFINSSHLGIWLQIDDNPDDDFVAAL
jgi:hypothetical protein